MSDGIMNNIAAEECFLLVWEADFGKLRWVARTVDEWDPKRHGQIVARQTFKRLLPDSFMNDTREPPDYKVATMRFMVVAECYDINAALQYARTHAVHSYPFKIDGALSQERLDLLKFIDYLVISLDMIRTMIYNLKEASQ